MKKLGYLALVLISVLALGSCVINLNDDYGDTYIRVTWATSEAPKAWTSSNPAIESSVADPESGLAMIEPASSIELNDLNTYYKTNSGTFTFRYLAYNNSRYTFTYTIPKNYSSFSKDYTIFLDDYYSYGADFYEE